MSIPIAYPALPRKTLQRLSWAENAPIQTASSKAVLKSLAHHADPSGKAWPAVPTLARWCSLSLSTTRRALRDLERKGWIRTYVRSGNSSEFMVKAPGEFLCTGCAFRLPDLEGVTACPSCGLYHLGGGHSDRGGHGDREGGQYDRGGRSQ